MAKTFERPKTIERVISSSQYPFYNKEFSQARNSEKIPLHFSQFPVYQGSSRDIALFMPNTNQRFDKYMSVRDFKNLKL